MLDDIGFGDASVFGGPAATPALERLASEGLRYNRFHTTSLCSPTRAALLTGRNHHRLGFGAVGSAPYAGYAAVWPKSAASVATVLSRDGYSTAAFGKWHNTPPTHISPIGPFDRWPTGLGFDYYYGNMIGASSQWTPQLWRNTLFVPQPKRPEEGYHFTSDIVSESIQWLRTVRSTAPQKPYFLYVAPEAVHAPHHAPQAWIDRYKGRFDQGWDRLREETFRRQKKLGVIPANTQLTPRPSELAAWDSLSPQQRRQFASQMEVYAGFVSHTDHEIGRLLEELREQPDYEDTLILYIVGDNGPEGYAEGTISIGSYERGSNTYAAPWAWAGSAPFQWMKGVASHLGATRNPMIVSYPRLVRDRGGLRSQFTHVNDIVPTIYELAGIRPPKTVDGVKQMSLDGVSFAYSFASPASPSRHTIQYFEMWGNRAIYQDGWLASARHGDPRWPGARPSAPGDFELDRWELYNLDQDFSQAKNLAAKYPARLATLRSRFLREARRNNVLPLNTDAVLRASRPSQNRTRFTYRSGYPSGPAYTGPQFTDHSFRLSALVATGGDGVLASAGSLVSGFGFFVKDGRLHLSVRTGKSFETFRSPRVLPPGRARLEVEVRKRAGYAGGDLVTFFIDGVGVGSRTMRLPNIRYDEFDVGRDDAVPMSDLYAAPFPSAGLERLDVDITDGAIISGMSSATDAAAADRRK